MKKRVFSVILALLMMFACFLTACAGSAGPAGPAGPEGPEGPEGPQGPGGSSTVEVATYIPAPYKLTGGKTIDSQIFDPVFYENENGPTIGVTMLGVIKIGDKYFRDMNNNCVLDPFEDWRLDAATRARYMANSLSDTQLTHNLLNVATNNPAAASVSAAVDENNKPVWSKVFPSANSVASLNNSKMRNFVVRSNTSSTEVTVWFNNGLEQYSEWYAIQNDETAVPFMSFTNPIGHGMPGSEGITAAALGDGNADLVLEDAQYDGRVMWAKGIDGIYGPQIDLVTDPRWSRNTGTYGERVDMAEKIARNLTIGYQNGDKGMVKGSTLLTIKHFPGDGSAYNGLESHANPGRYRIYQTENSLANYQLKPFIAGFEAGAAGVMPGYSQPSNDARNAPQSITYNGKTTDILFGGYGNAFNENMTALLRDVLGFDGLINSDSLGAASAHGVNEYGDNLTPLQQTVLFVKNCDSGVFGTASAALIMQALNEGLVTRAELRRAAYNRLKPRAQSGDLDNPYRDMEESLATVNELTPKVAALAEATNLKSVVLMKNTGNVLPLKEADKTKKIYTQLYSSAATSSRLNTVISNTDHNLEAPLTALGYTNYTTNIAEADIAYLRVSPTLVGQSSGNLAVLDLGQNFTTTVYDNNAKPSGTTTIHTVRTMAEFKQAADAVHANGGKVIGEIVATNSWILTEMEPYCDALIGSVGSSQAAIAKVVTGGYNPTGKLPLTMIAHASVIALETKTINGETWDICVSPNDVPGYEKPKYMKAEVLAASPSGTYAYKDAAGNFYWSGFGLRYPA